MLGEAYKRLQRLAKKSTTERNQKICKYTRRSRIKFYMKNTLFRLSISSVFLLYLSGPPDKPAEAPDINVWI